MELLHKDLEIFQDAINNVVYKTGLEPKVIEKDYYVTMILKELSDRFDFIVFKGGTSLSKCHRAIKRFSEDIDITIDTAVSSGQRRKVQRAIEDTAEKLWMRLSDKDWKDAREDYQRYHFEYESFLANSSETVSPEVMLETSYMEISFPVMILPVHSYIGDLFADEAPELLMHYGLSPFEMKVQSIERSLIDKVFAICDYFMAGRVNKYSRHLYDIYKLNSMVKQDESFKELIQEVRKERMKQPKCLSSQEGIYIPGKLKEIIETDAYKDDYNKLTVNLIEESDMVDYNVVIETIRQIAESGLYE